MSPTKACPIVLRGDAVRSILAFVHPLAGRQLIKGGIEADESAAEAALRELGEEAGVRNARVAVDLGDWPSGFEGQVWALQLCAVTGPLPDTWTHRAADDGGHDFRFFWQPLDELPSSDWHRVYIDALKEIRNRLALQATSATS